VDLVAPEHQSVVKRIFRQMDQRVDLKIRKTVRTIIFDGNNRDTWLSLNILPIYTPDGKIDHYFGMCRNETEMVATEQQLKKESEKAQEAELLKSSFLTNMSYELRTPLNAVLGFAELLSLEHDPEDEPIFVEQIKENSNTLLALVNDALFLSRLDARMVEFKRDDVDFAIMFEGFCQLGWAGNLKPGVTTLVENPYNSLVVSIDTENLGQVLQKVCAHAAYCTTEGFIRAKYEYRRGELNITIEDTGKGMDGEALKNIFGRFVTKKENGREGTGLAMPIVKELVEQMGGIIDVSSEEGKGTTTWITIPCEQKVMDKKRDTLV
jgi:signal transduction histidine kinase